MKTKIIISCEHAGNQIPNFLGNDVKVPTKILTSHRGLDIGALDFTRMLSRATGIAPFVNKISRLVIDYNRSTSNPHVWSSYTRPLSPNNKGLLIKGHQRYREKIIKSLSKKCVHLSIHSFTPILNGVKRNCQIGILFDSRIKTEREVAMLIKKAFQDQGLVARLNYPYQGRSDGLTTFVRNHPHSKRSKYVGIELEFNQFYLKKNKFKSQALKALLPVCLKLQNSL